MTSTTSVPSHRIKKGWGVIQAIGHASPGHEIKRWPSSTRHARSRCYTKLNAAAQEDKRWSRYKPPTKPFHAKLFFVPLLHLCLQSKMVKYVLTQRLQQAKNNHEKFDWLHIKVSQGKNRVQANNHGDDAARLPKRALYIDASIFHHPLVRNSGHIQPSLLEAKQGIVDNEPFQKESSGLSLDCMDSGSTGQVNIWRSGDWICTLNDWVLLWIWFTVANNFCGYPKGFKLQSLNFQSSTAVVDDSTK